MSNEEWIRNVAKIARMAASSENSRDYVMNEGQMEKYARVYAYLERKAEEQNGVFQPSPLSPADLHGGLSAQFLVFDICDAEGMKEFCDVMSVCSALTIDGLSDGSICISCVVPDVYKKK